MDTEPALLLVDIIFKTLYIYDDRGSRKAVDGITTKEELKDARIPYKDSPEFVWLLKEFSSTSSKSSSLFEQCKPTFLDIYLRAILNAREKPAKGLSLSQAFHPLFRHMLHEDFENSVLPSAVKMRKRNPEIVLESVGILLNSVNLDLSKYAVEIISVAFPQAGHADEGRRVGALAIIRCVSQKSSNPDALEAMFNAVKSNGMEGKVVMNSEWNEKGRFQFEQG
ncbi:unnamed protein product [Prunus armeniaca]|uniref:Stalled ribosome sensor GCN1-like N-terminal domain-containing protein n=1 Tax=Prunus armeniaca TaxID=36596 RepID=A0A6J5W780_PRUAR|nr:unnamed protein product [Prunus armeniaca]CAB4297460.1 unnamed protein product [Prunus armeniaca]